MKFEISDLDNVLILKFPRLLTSDHLAEIVKYLTALDETLAVTPHRLNDMSDVEEVLFHYGEMEHFANLRRKAKLKNPTKCAIVAPKPLHMGFARMFQTLNDHPQINVKIFPDPISARKWLNKSC